MDIRPIDLSSDDELRAAYDVDTRAQLLGREGSPHWSYQEMAGMYRHPDSGERQDLLGGFVGDRLVGLASSYVGLLDNLDKAWVAVHVDPVHQRRGYGGELLAAITDLLAADGRTLLVGETKLPFAARETHGYRRFCERHGYEFANVEVVRWLTLPVADEVVQRWADLAAERHTGYTLETYVNDVPEELIPSLCVLLGQLGVDAPTGAVDWEEEVITPERFAESRTSLVTAGRTIYETLAVTPDRTVAAHSTMSVPPPGRTDVSQWGTFVHREHRGRRLGLATKAANLRAMQQAQPEMKRIVTQNAETNDFMVSINVLMGFEPVEASTEMFRKL
ncbi:MAG: GNAT family N-acetyltransferase [Actinomycetota bacterium]|nr:GNAT family N-acetyltransferase [Actinomycetota bacterium]